MWHDADSGIDAAYLNGVEAVHSIASSYSPEEWLQESTCRGWRAVDVLRHLYGVVLEAQWILRTIPRHGPRELMTERQLNHFNCQMLKIMPQREPFDQLLRFESAATHLPYQARDILDADCYIHEGRIWSVREGIQFLAVEWHLHAWDLAATISRDYLPTSAAALARIFRAGPTRLPPPAGDNWDDLLAAAGRRYPPGGAKAGAPADADLARRRSHLPRVGLASGHYLSITDPVG